MKIKKYLNTKTFSTVLALGVFMNSIPINSFARILSEDSRYETFEGSDITINDILEEDKVDVEIEGNTIVNVANQKDPVPITKKYTVEGTNHISLQGEYDGKSRPVIEGNTLVNLYDISKVKTNNQAIVSGDRIIVTTTNNVYSNFFLNDYSMIKTNTLYTIIVDVYKNTLDLSDYIWINSCINGDSSVIKDTSNMKISGGKTGRFIFTSKSVSDFSSCKRLLRSFIDNKSQIVGAEVDLSIMMFEGDLTSSPPTEYFEGLKSSFEDQLVTQEMVNSGIEKAENLGKYKVEYNIIGKNKFSDYDRFIEIKPNMSYRLTGTTNTPENRLKFRVYDKNFNNITSPTCMISTRDFYYAEWLGDFMMYGNNASEIKTSIKFSEEARYVRFLDNNFLNLQLEEGTVVTEYEPYKESIKTFYLNSPLLEGDTIEDIDGKATHIRRCKEIILNGSEQLGENNFTIARDNTVTRYMYLPNGKLSNTINSSFNNDKKSVNHDVEGILHDGYDLLYIAIDKSRLQTFDTNGIKKWFQNNPTRVVYTLLNPVYETISEESILCDSYINGHLDLNTNIPINKVDFIPTTTNLNYLYPSTEYTIQFESDNEGKIDKVLLGDKVLYTNYSVNRGINRFNITTPNEISSTELILDGIGFNLSNLVVTEAIDNDFDYFEGIKSVGQDDINEHRIEIISTNLDNSESNRVEILLSEPLRGLPNAKDKIIKRNGQWFVERNCKEIILNGKENWNAYYGQETETRKAFNYNLNPRLSYDFYRKGEAVSNFNFYGASIGVGNSRTDEGFTLGGSFDFVVYTHKSKLSTCDTEGFKKWLSENPITVVYQLKAPIYEPLNIDSSINIYLDTTHISTNSIIPANLKVTVDRTINRATEAVELAKANPTIANLSRARYWTNLLKESTKKDELQEEINNNTDIVDLQLERKTTSANLDLYIKCENMLSMSLDTNQISFDDFSGIEDVEKINAVNISINSSLPYQLNAYLPNEIQNSDKSKTMNKEILQLKESNESDYKEFANINEKVILKDNCNSGNQLVHGIDIMLKGGVAHEKDVYKAVIKLEAEQK